MRLLRTAIALVGATALVSLGLMSRASAEELSPQDLYDKVVKSCVYIITPLKGGYAQGSGSLIDAEQKLVLTNFHVVDQEKFVYVQFPIYIKGELLVDKDKYKERVPAGLAIKGTVLYRDKTRDLAIVQLDRVPTGTPAIPLARTSPRLGETVWQIGNAGAVKQVFRVSKGDVSAVKPEKFKVGGGGEILEINARMVTATNPTNPGDSGGPLFDKRGYLVAVTESGSTTASLVNHFVDVTEVRGFLKQKTIAIKELGDGAEPSTVAKNPKLTTPGKAGNTGTPVVDGEKAAAAMLSRAKLFASGEDLRPDYIAKLKDVVKKWPNTAAGKEAKKLLDAMK